MGRQGDLWDDSALINAFDDAISTYKKMHFKKADDGITDEVIVSTSRDHSSSEADDRKETTSQGNTDDKSILASSSAVGVGESVILSSINGNHCTDSISPEAHVKGAQEGHNDYSNPLGGEDYNELLNQYYELEDKRQKILERLHQYGGWNYQPSGESSGAAEQWVNGSTYQEYPMPVNQASNSTVICSCCPCASQCCIAPCTSIPACSLGGSYDCKSYANACLATNSQKSSIEDSCIVKTAMGAAEKAISSIGKNISADSYMNKESKKAENEGEINHSTSPDTDLSALLNAWYSAGFYTGKYLVEQSMTKRQS